MKTQKAGCHMLLNAASGYKSTGQENILLGRVCLRYHLQNTKRQRQPSSLRRTSGTG